MKPMYKNLELKLSSFDEVNLKWLPHQSSQRAKNRFAQVANDLS